VANITVRRLAPSDSIAELTSLLHRAYAKQVAMGLRPLAGRQDQATTRKRVFSGECWVAVEHVGLPDPADPTGLARETKQKLVGCILYHEIEDAEGPAWFHRSDVAWFSQFAVDTGYQGAGIGQMLLETVEQRAREERATELALSMAEPDVDLKNYYLKRGYRIVDQWQWPYTNYRSIVMSKAMAPSAGSSA
jgi:GNAT superfamily N-acetyltransferase